jgi:hypothetical protein
MERFWVPVTLSRLGSERIDRLVPLQSVIEALSQKDPLKLLLTHADQGSSFCRGGLKLHCGHIVVTAAA